VIIIMEVSYGQKKSINKLRIGWVS